MSSLVKSLWLSTLVLVGSSVGRKRSRGAHLKSLKSPRAMKIRMRSSEEQIAIYREGAGVVVYVIALAIGCIAFGALFFYIGDSRAIFLAFGSLFVVAGALVLTSLPKWFSENKRTTAVWCCW